jgi:hypothetical protein
MDERDDHTGAQFRLPPKGHRGHRSLSLLGDWVSIGGGGGCGTADSAAPATASPTPSSRPILCGRELDADALQGPDAASLSGRLNATLRWCRNAGYEVRIAGGGGGGGGTAECCEGFSVGFGFSFRLLAPGRVVVVDAADAADADDADAGDADGGEEQQAAAAAEKKQLSPSPTPTHHGGGRETGKGQQEEERHHPHHDHNHGGDEEEEEDGHDNHRRRRHHHHHHHRHTGGRRWLQPAAPVPPGAAQAQSGEGVVPRDAIEAQLRYDPLFRYLYNASQACPGGFQSWCCGACWLDLV